MDERGDFGTELDDARRDADIGNPARLRETEAGDPLVREQDRDRANRLGYDPRRRPRPDRRWGCRG